ncbi:glutaredoxin family protein [Sulfuriferula nivalis]|uniref:Glutaredoxin n=1 Tax=Sulfuriferula nivalis TaxID=2675298 RepID=A0A809RFN0_9PROT|nr:glutaredoxin domain-containing protein [Sulfuriferula nivalis]BBP00639.1 glutaredoxin [Sulfuriferula nivalis]
MKFFFRIFFKTLRLVLTPFMLLWEKMTTPKGVVRQPEVQQRIDQQCKNMAIYQFKTCPFCIKVRRELARLSLSIPLLDAQHDSQNKEALLQGGGRVQVPCLRIMDEQGKTVWIYESSEIIKYLHEHFA